VTAFLIPAFPYFFLFNLQGTANRMRDFSKKIIPVIGKFSVLGLSILGSAGVGILSKGINIGGSIAVNLLSDIAKEGYTGFLKRIIPTHPNELNHDIRKVLKEAFNQAMANMLVLYREQAPPGNSFKIAGRFIKAIQKSGVRLLAEKFAVQQTILTEKLSVDDEQQKIMKEISLELESVDLDPGFKVFFADNFLFQFRLCFAEGLKSNDNHKAWVAFQMLMTEGIKRDIKDILKAQDSLSTELSELKKQNALGRTSRLSPQKRKELELLLKEFNSPEKLEISYNKALREWSADMMAEVKKLGVLGAHTFEEVKAVSKKITTGSRIAVAAIIAGLGSCIVIIYFLAVIRNQNNKIQPILQNRYRDSVQIIEIAKYYYTGNSVQQSSSQLYEADKTRYPLLKLEVSDTLAIKRTEFHGAETFVVCSVSEISRIGFINRTSKSLLIKEYIINWGDTTEIVLQKWNSNQIIYHDFRQGNSIVTFSVHCHDGTIIEKKFNVFSGIQPAPASGLYCKSTMDLNVNQSLDFYITGSRHNPDYTVYRFSVNDGSEPLVFLHPPLRSIGHIFTKSSNNINSRSGSGSFYKNAYTASLIVETPCGVVASEIAPIIVK
jgi:hypothetical protein